MKKLGFFLAGLIGTLAFGGLSFAAGSNVSSHGIGLSPAIANVSLDQNLATTSFKINVSNNLTQAVTLKLTSLDFKSLNDTGGVAFINNGSGKYGLANWLILPAQPMVVAPRSSQSVTVSVDNRADLSPGGHYAAVLFQDVNAPKGGNNKVAVNQVVATLVFLKKSGGEIFSLNMQKPSFGASWLKLPSNLDLFIKNTGNTQTVPRGTVSIADPRGRSVARGVINIDSGLVLPDSTRLFRTPIFMTNHSWLPGRYTATISYQPEDIRSATTVSYSFFYLNVLSLLVLIILIATGWWLWRSRAKVRRRLVFPKM